MQAGITGLKYRLFSLLKHENLLHEKGKKKWKVHNYRRISLILHHFSFYVTFHCQKLKIEISFDIQFGVTCSSYV